MAIMKDTVTEMYLLVKGTFQVHDDAKFQLISLYLECT